MSARQRTRRVWRREPGDPLIGIVTAADHERWVRLGAWVTYLDREIARIRRLVRA